MAKFIITAINPENAQFARFHYDNASSELTRESGESVVQAVEVAERADAPAVSRQTPLGKTSPRVLKISLGLSCNYACEYCSQRFVARNAETNPEDVTGFMASLDSWVRSPPEAIEFWGGEPLVYIKTLRPLAEALRLKFPEARFSVITNGSLLNPQINQWLNELGFTVSISHDGPGQHVRGPDPLEAFFPDLEHQFFCIVEKGCDRFAFWPETAAGDLIPDRNELAQYGPLADQFGIPFDVPGAGDVLGQLIEVGQPTKLLVLALQFEFFEDSDDISGLIGADE